MLSGQKIWISTAQVANKILILARTTPLEQVKRRTEGLSLFYTDLDRSKVAIRVIDKMGRHAVDSNEMFFDGMAVPAADRIGPEGEGFRSILHGMNPERILIAAEAVGIGRAALQRAAKYARERVVFRRPIGQNQGIAHPLAQCWMELEAANLMVMKAAWLYDQGRNAAPKPMPPSIWPARRRSTACETAVMTHGGMGYSKEFHVERYLREVMIPRIAPITPHMILNFIAEKVLRTCRSRISVSAPPPLIPAASGMIRARSNVAGVEELGPVYRDDDRRVYQRAAHDSRRPLQPTIKNPHLWSPMTIPKPVYNPPFNITRASHSVLTVKDLGQEPRTSTSISSASSSATKTRTRSICAAWRRRATTASCSSAPSGEPQAERVGMRVFTEEDLEKAKAHLRRAPACRRNGSRCRTRAARCMSRTRSARRSSSAPPWT